VTPTTLEILALGRIPGENELLGWLAAELRDRFGFEAVDIQMLPDDPRWHEPGREQLSSNRIVDALVDRATDAGNSHEELWTLAVTDADLTGGGRDYVFGEATLGGGWALVSTARLHRAGATDLSDPRLRRRLLTEVVHELGHLAGLLHCDSPGCAMQPSVTPEDTDRKTPDFCERCNSARGRA
jgi:archaemetzincin